VSPNGFNIALLVKGEGCNANPSTILSLSEVLAGGKYGNFTGGIPGGETGGIGASGGGGGITEGDGKLDGGGMTISFDGGCSDLTSIPSYLYILLNNISFEYGTYVLPLVKITIPKNRNNINAI